MLEIIVHSQPIHHFLYIHLRASIALLTLILPTPFPCPRILNIQTVVAVFCQLVKAIIESIPFFVLSSPVVLFCLIYGGFIVIFVGG